MTIENETKLSALFEAQNFFKNARLEQLISDTHRRYAANGREKLDDDVLDLYAAGDIDASKEKRPDEHLPQQ